MIWRRLFGSRKRDFDIDEEIRSHLRMAEQDRIDRGEPPESARLAAAREFGNAGLVKETTRAVWIWTAFEQILQDFRSATRILTKSPGFSAAAVTLVAMGIGWNTTIYSIIHGILTKPAPGVDGRGLVSFGLTTNGRPDEPEHSFPDYLDFAAQTKTLGPVLAFGFERFTATLKDGSYAFNGVAVTANYFETLGVRLVKGRPLSTADLATLASGVPIVISFRVWQQQFRKTADIIGRTVLLNGFLATISGVAPEGFHGTWLSADLDVWVPIVGVSLNPALARELNDRSRRNLILIGRLSPGATLSEAQAEFYAISKRLQSSYPDTNKRRTVVLAPYSASAFSPIQRAQGRLFMAILTVVALLTLLVVCANVANLMLARATLRQKEMAVRQSIGASQIRVLRMLLAEGLVLSVTALAAAWFFAFWACHAIVRLMPPNGRGAPVDANFTPDTRVTLYAMLLTVVSALAFTAAPAVRAWGQELLPWLKAGEHSVAHGRSKLATILVVTQLALCVLLLTSAGLAYRSLSLVNAFDLGFNRDHLLLVTLNTSGAVKGKQQNLALLERIRERLGAVPGIVAVSYAGMAPPRSSWSSELVQAIGSGQSVRADGNFVGPDYLEALGVPGVIGRGISVQDLNAGKMTAVINRSLAEALWPGESALGRTIFAERQKQTVEVVGVVPNGAFSGFIGPGGEFANARQAVRRGFLFLSELQSAGMPGERTFHLRYTGGLEAIVPAVRSAVRDVDARVPLAYVRTMDAQLDDFTRPAAMITTLLGLFAIGSLILAAIGLHSVIAFHTARRRREFGIRIALGASYGQVVHAVLREGLVLTCIGVLIGLALSAATGQALRNLLFGVTPTDKITYLIVISLLAAVSLFACYVPARRAARISPVEALRQE